MTNTVNNDGDNNASSSASAAGDISTTHKHEITEAISHITMRFEVGSDAGLDPLGPKRKGLFQEKIRQGIINNPDLNGAYIVRPEKRDAQGSPATVTGIDTAYRIIARNPDAKIIMVSTIDKEGVKQMARNAGKEGMFNVINAHPHTRFIDMRAEGQDPYELCNKLSFGTKAISTEEVSEKAKTPSVHFDLGENDVRENAFKEEFASGKITNPELDGAHIIIPEQSGPGSRMQQLVGLRHAYDLIKKDPTTKVVIASFLHYSSVLEAIANKNEDNKDMLTILKAHPSVTFVALPASIEVRNTLSFTKRSQDTEDSIEAMQKMTLHFDTGNDERWKERFEKHINEGKLKNRELDNAHFIIPEKPDEQKIRTSLTGLDSIYELITNNPQAKVVVMYSYDSVETLGQMAERANKGDIFTLIKAHPFVQFVSLQKAGSLSESPQLFNDISFTKKSDTQKVSNEEIIKATYNMGARHIAIILHALKP